MWIPETCKARAGVDPGMLIEVLRKSLPRQVRKDVATGTLKRAIAEDLGVGS